MPYVVADRVKETSTSTGTGAFTLAGAVTGFRTFSSAIGNGNNTTYVITNATGSEWEVGYGLVTAGTLTRVAVFSSSNANNTVNFSAGTKSVFVSMSANPVGSNTTLGASQTFNPNAYSSTTVIGVNAAVNGNGATAVGVNTTANNSGVAVGYNAIAGLNGVAIGSSVGTENQRGVAIGKNALVYNFVDDGVAIGSNAAATADRGVAIGNYATAGSVGTAIGQGTAATGGFSTGVGTYASSTGSYSTALGGSVTADQTDQFAVRVRVNPSGVSPTVYELKYDNTAKEIYATSGGGGGGVTQIIAGPGISISPPTGVGIVTISAGGGGGFDWFQQDPSPVDGNIATPTIFTNSPSGTGFLVVAGFVNLPFSPSGAPWNPGGAGGWFGQMYYVSSFGWGTLSSPYSYASGASQGVAFNYVQYPPGHSLSGYINVFGSSTGWSSNFGGSFGVFYPSPPGTGKKLYGVIVISSGGTDLSGVVSINPSFPATEFTAYYDAYSGATVVAFQNPDNTQVFDILNMGMSFIGWGSAYSYYGHAWYEYN